MGQAESQLERFGQKQTPLKSGFLILRGKVHAAGNAGVTGDSAGSQGHIRGRGTP